MKTDVNYVLSTTDETDSGNVVCLLSALSGKEEAEIEAVLRRGISPWLLANELDVLSEFKEEILGYLLTQLSKSVEESQISQEQADELVAEFEMNFAELEERFARATRK